MAIGILARSIIAFSVAWLPSVVMAADVKLELVLAGEAYQGAPSFALRTGDEELGTGTVLNAVDTETQGHLSPANIAEHSQSFTFSVSEASLATGLQVVFTNDKVGSQGSANDRNLYVVSVSVAGSPVPLTALGLIEQAKPLAADLAAVPLFHNGDGVLIKQPVSASVKAGKGQACGKLASVSISFEINSADLDPGAKSSLDRLAGSLRGLGCTVTIAGYSSMDGNRIWNEALARKRGQAVRDYLKAVDATLGVRPVVYGGQTTQFGPPSTNRRVVIVPSGS